jgi:hypothetical protein
MEDQTRGRRAAVLTGATIIEQCRIRRRGFSASWPNSFADFAVKNFQPEKSRKKTRKDRRELPELLYSATLHRHWKISRVASAIHS